MVAELSLLAEAKLGETLSLIWVAPFAAMLLSIAVMPLAKPHFWHHHFHHVAIGLGLACAIPFIGVFGSTAAMSLAHIMVADYVPFVILLWALFTVSGGILIKGTLVGKPITNALIMLIGAVIASFVGTTGASMLLIRPIIRANATRHYKAHTIVFFIFLVSNIGGALTPLGDPPLFIGFLKGVSFFWTAMHLWMHTLVCGGIVLAIYLLVDTILWARESADAKKAPENPEPLGVSGGHNALFLAGIIGAVLLSGSWKPKDIEFGRFIKHGEIQLVPAPDHGHAATGDHIKPDIADAVADVKKDADGKPAAKDDHAHDSHAHDAKGDHGGGHGHGLAIPVQNAVRDLILIAMGVLSLVTTPWSLREKNGFSWAPIAEVAWLFLGIFATIVPALEILGAGEKGALAFLIKAVSSEAHFFWATGGLSAVLDNAPTYLSFLTTAIGRFYPGEMTPEKVAMLGSEHPGHLAAISLGAVFMGAMTYIGNAPNFMVRSIAEEAGVKMPDFFSYILKYSLPVLVPTFVVITFVFFRGQ